MAIVLPAVPGSGTKVLGIKEYAGLVQLLLTDNVVQEAELDFRVFVVVDPTIGGVDVLPAVVVKIFETGAPEPARGIGMSFFAGVVKGTVAPVPQEDVAGRHLLEDFHEFQARLPEDLHVKRHVRHPNALLPGVRHVAGNRRPFRIPGFFGSDVGTVEVEPTIVIVVRHAGAHTCTVRQRTSVNSHIVKRAVSVVLVEGFASEIVHNIDVRETVVVVVAKDGAQAKTDLADPGFDGHVGEGAVVIVVIQGIRLAITGVEGSRDGKAGVKVPAHVEVKIPVIVIIGPGRNGGAAIFGKPGLRRHVGKSPVVVVVEKLIGLKRTTDEEIFVPVVVVVRKQNNADTIQTGKTGFRRHVFEFAIAGVMKELRFHAVGNHQVVETVIVIVGSGDPGGAVTDHGELQFLFDELRVVLIGEIYTGFGSNIAELRRV